MASISSLTVTLKGAVGLNIVSVEVDGAAVTLNPDRTWSVDVPAPAAGAGSLVTVTTYDDLGRSKTRTVTLERLTSAPI